MRSTPNVPNPVASQTGAAEDRAQPAGPRSRRALLAGALGGAAGWLAATAARIGPPGARAAAGDPLILGQTNFAGSSATRLNATSSGGAFWMTQYGSGSGVRGDSVNGHGGVFTTSHPDRYGLYAQQTGAYGSGAAVRGESGDSVGVVGSSSTWIGVAGGSPSYYGVYGSSNSGIGVVGYSSSGYAGYFAGPLYATSADANIKAFRIDHPLDPANKVLMHSCVESNERLTVYAGTVTTDAQGEATVTLPSYFGALNRDVRYQLTVIGSFAQAMVKREVTGNRFVIATSEPGTKVCWQLTGVRQDAYAKAHPLVVESAKTGKEKGRYLTPAEHGQPERLAVDYELRQGIRRAPAAPPA